MDPKKKADEVILDSTMFRAVVANFPTAIAIVRGTHILYANRAFAKKPFLLESQYRNRLTRLVTEEKLQRFDVNPRLITCTSSTLELETLVSVPNNSGVQIVYANSAPLWRKSDSSLPATRSPNISRMQWQHFAHEFNNFLTCIILYSELLSEELPPDSKLRKHAETIVDAGNKCADLIKRQRVPGRCEGDTDPNSWKILATEIVGLLKPFFSPEIEITTRFAQSAGWVNIDPVLVYRIILRLMVNAYQAMPNGGRLSISSRSRRIADSVKTRSGSKLCVEFVITDTGMGMDKQNMATRLRPISRKTRNPLGLIDIRNIINRAGGEFEISSELGRGTTVTIRMPVIQ